MITQGWDWQKVTKLSLCYYLILGIIATVISVSISVVIGQNIEYSFQAYANTINVPLLTDQYLVVSGIVISLAISTLAAYFAVWRMKKMGLDNLLREC